MDCEILNNKIKKSDENLKKIEEEEKSNKIDNNNKIEDPFFTDDNTIKTTKNEDGSITTELQDIVIHPLKFIGKLLNKIDFITEYTRTRKASVNQKTDVENKGAVQFISLLIEESVNHFNSMKGFSVSAETQKINNILESSYSMSYNENIKLYKKDGMLNSNQIDLLKIYGIEVNPKNFNEVLEHFATLLENEKITESQTPKSVLNYLNDEFEIREKIRKDYGEVGIEYNNSKYYTNHNTDNEAFKKMYNELGKEDTLKLFKKSIYKGAEKNKIDILDKKNIKTLNEIADSLFRFNVNKIFKHSDDSAQSELLNLKNEFFNGFKKILADEDNFDTVVKDFELNGYNVDLIKSLIEDINSSLKNRRPGHTQKRTFMDPFEYIEANGKKYRLNDTFSKNKLNNIRRLVSNSTPDLIIRRLGSIKVDGYNKPIDLSSYNSVSEYFTYLSHNHNIDTKKLYEVYRDVRNGGIKEKIYGDGNTNKILRIAGNYTSSVFLQRVWMSGTQELTKALAFGYGNLVIKNTDLALNIMIDIKKPKSEWNETTKIFYDNYKELFSDNYNSKISGEDNMVNDLVSGDPNSLINRVLDNSELAKELGTNFFGQLRNITRLSNITGVLQIRSKMYGDILTDKFYKLDNEFDMVNNVKTQRYNQGRLNDLGLSLEDINNIKKEQLKHPSKSMNYTDIQNSMDKWDPKVRQKLDRATSIKLREIVLNPTSGQSLRILKENPFLKLVFQYQSFIMAAYGSNTLKGLKHKDKEALSLFMYQFGIQMMVQSLKNYDSYNGKKLKEQNSFGNLTTKTLFNMTELSYPAQFLNTIAAFTPFAQPIKESIGGSRFTSNILNPPSLQFATKVKDLLNKSLFDSDNLKYKDIKDVMFHGFTAGVATSESLEKELNKNIFSK